MSSLHKKAQVLEFKRGDTVMLGCTAIGEDNLPVNLSTTTITAQIRDGEDALICDMDVVPVNLAIGTFELWAPDATNFVPGDHTIDVQYVMTVTGRPITRSTETFYVRIIQDVTR